MTATVTASTAIRQQNLGAVLGALSDARPASRADLAALTQLSKPTVAAALRTFEQAGLVRKYGRTTGRRGPTAALYDLVPDAVLVLGIDIGAHYVRSLLADLEGRALEQETIALEHPRLVDVLAALRRIRARIAPYAQRIEVAVVGSPGIVDPVSGRIGAAPNIASWEGIVAATALQDTLGLAVHVENDVNLAALGEQAGGAGKGVESFVYLNVGSGLGAGIVLHGQLHRGARGAAGEVGFLPVGDDPFGAARGLHAGAMESSLSSRGLIDVAERLAATTETSVPAPFDVRDLFEAARGGDDLGRAIVKHAAREIAVCVAGVMSVVDVELVLLGGGIGASAELLIPDVRSSVAQLVPAPPRVERATLGERGVLTGAVAVALEDARHTMLRRFVTASEP
jgi:predicted NBD/HSP70 family sugar kinase